MIRAYLSLRCMKKNSSGPLKKKLNTPSLTKHSLDVTLTSLVVVELGYAKLRPVEYVLNLIQKDISQIFILNTK